MQRTYRFGQWHIQPELNLLVCDGRKRKIERKAMEVLVCLLERPGEVISVQGILDQVWSGRVVEENSVHRRISQIRKALDDDPKNPRYVGHVPRRGYHSLAPVQTEHSTAQHPDSVTTPLVPIVTGSRDAPVLTIWQSALVTVNRWAMVDQDRYSYVVLALLGFLPIIAAPMIGIWDDRSVPADNALAQICPLNESQASTRGFSGRWNWLIYPVLLPAWLFFSRLLFRRSLGYSASSPLIKETRYAAIRNRVRSCLSYWQATAFIIALNLVVTAIDQSDVAMRFIDVSQVCPTGVMDWGWYALVFGDVTTANLIWFTLWTTGEQMLLVHLALNTAAFVFLFNLNYMRSMYLRSEPARQTDTFVLEFDDADGRFGLRKISTIFDWQLGFCVAGGAVLLVERYFNTRLAIVDQLAHQVVCQLYDALPFCSGLPSFNWSDASWLLQDTAQVFIVVSWLVFFLTILSIANVKLLPLRTMGETGGRISYLQEFLPPGSKNDAALASADIDEIETIAAKFRAQHFWPTGDDRAADTLFFCLLIFCLMLFPVLPVSVPQIVMLVLMVILSWVGTRLFFAIQKHLLARVDRSLAQV